MIYSSNSSKRLKQGPPKAISGDVFVFEERMNASLSFFAIDLQLKSWLHLFVHSDTLIARSLEFATPWP
jgi:hypothetical protein